MYNSWNFDDADDRKKPDKILEKFVQHLEPKSNHRIHRYQFQHMRQEPEETVDNFMSKLKNVAAKYKLESDKEMEERLVDQLIWGSCHPDVQKKLIGRNEKLTLKDAIDVARSFEATNKQMRLLASNQDYSSPNKSVNTIKKYSKPQSYKPQQQTKICNNCGKTHDISARKNCPAYGSQCHKCGKMNHWQSVCKSSKKIQNRPTQRRNRQQIHDIGYNTDMTEEETLTIGTIHANDNREEVYTLLQIERAELTQKINLKCKVDTGAQSNVLPLRLFRNIFPDKIDSKGNPKPNALQGTNMILSAYGGSQIKQLGTITIPCQHRGRKINCIFYVTDATGPAILGLKACRALNLISLHCAIESKHTTNAAKQTAQKSPNYIDSDIPLKDRPPIRDKEHLLQMYPDCFDNVVGCFENYTYHITLDPKVPPVVHAARRIPIELRDRLKTELTEMENKNIITKVNQPTDWVNSLVIREKENGRLRLCLDPKDLNTAIKQEHHPTPTLEEITHKLTGAKRFSKLDARNGYWNVKLDEESSVLTTFNTPFGRYRSYECHLDSA
uniref:Uncharacterized protein LOC102805367 n=1 Tax=Saccoglossus kowalevskii TaxID=10224 RepID=A0ABM0MV46_SACKO|nr:PREDICTED: uncharacterized protein LOC102805367 [Saccoglossus kowalevskii]